ncbi:Reverse transcriptase, RNase H-like domain [Fusarium oxysporum f. sp. vasinfectum]|uniref:Reverse transcriptase RNase H-like domain-containing protein n=1 Tax=Fusarium oxysporum f. sp. vasinfectum 25433 TaxID=1089449 RepID=X0L0L5_FUSOX|nr:hypothetical protein FOTG_16995 [Fusarium oxysporum f. sp. vasinfectum 25433]KAK2926635.1 Reverse transcriptase, RNase H-like domain [Fusarium oxysporum f. sp. vasinfectum]
MVDENGIRQSQKRRKKFAQLKKHLRRTRPGPLLHLATQFVRKFIPGTADPIQRIKEVFFEFRNEDKVLETISREAGNKTRYTSAESNAAAALESICDSIQDNINSGADSTKQFHLATDASENGTRGVLQLDDTSAGEDSTEKDFKNAGVIMWISGRFNEADLQYMMQEREMLAVVRGSQESHWMIKHASHPRSISRQGHPLDRNLEE